MVEQLPSMIGWRTAPDTVLPLVRALERGSGIQTTFVRMGPNWRGPVGPILLPVGEGPPTDAALDLVAGLARPHAVEVVVLRVVEPGSPRRAGAGAGDPPLADPYTLADAQRQVDWLASRLAARGTIAYGRAILGRLPGTILESADRIGAGLIAMSRDHRGAPTGAAGDGVLAAVVRQSRLPIVVVRQGAPPPDGDRRVPAGAAGHDGDRHPQVSPGWDEGGSDERA